MDARHWKLPNEIMNKLAINDVDLQHSEPINAAAAATGQTAGSNSDDSSAVVNISNHVQAGGGLEKADQPRATSTRSPSSQMSPR